MWAKIRRVWAVVGVSATIVFVVWSLIAYRAQPFARAALESDERVTVTRGDNHWILEPSIASNDVGLLFIPGALVEAEAYAPIARAIAEHGHTALLVELPRRGLFGGGQGPEILERARTAAAAVKTVRRWVIAGHSLGGLIAARLVQSDWKPSAALVLIGTTHPRDFSLAALQLPVTRVFGTRDTVATVEKTEANAGNLPASTRLIRVDGGNHSQFGYYGFQPGDWPATIDRASQQRFVLSAILDAFDAVR